MPVRPQEMNIVRNGYWWQQWLQLWRPIFSMLAAVSEKEEVVVVVVPLKVEEAEFYHGRWLDVLMSLIFLAYFYVLMTTKSKNLEFFYKSRIWIMGLSAPFFPFNARRWLLFLQSQICECLWSISFTFLITWHLFTVSPVYLSLSSFFISFKWRSLSLNYTEQEIKQWREERRNNYPSKCNANKVFSSATLCPCFHSGKASIW